MAWFDMDVKTDIRRRLAVLVADISMSGKKNLHDVNVYSEGFIGELLNLVWGLELKDLNTYAEVNFPGIDLGDQTNSVCIQVTSSPRREKIRKTIAKYLDENHSSTYADLRFVFLCLEKPDITKPIKRQDELSFSLENQLYNADDLLTEIFKLPTDKLTEVYEWLKEHVKLDETDPSTVEAVILKKYFRRVRDVDLPEDLFGTELVDHTDIAAKQEYFRDFWQQLTIDYTACLDRTLEKKFESAFSTIDESDRERMKRYLKSVSISLLLESNNPLTAIEKMKTKIITDLKMNLVSEVEVKNFLYYQLYRCRVFPLEVLYASSVV